MYSKNFTGIKDVDLTILQKLSDIDLLNICETNQYFRKLCTVDNFWFNRISIFFNLKYEEIKNLKAFLNFTDYRNLYIFLSKKTSDDIKYYVQEKYINNIIRRNLLENCPKWINRDELVFEIRRRFSQSMYNSERPDTEAIILINKITHIPVVIPGGFTRRLNPHLNI